MLQSLKNIYYLGIKEIRGLLKDWLMLVLIIYSFSYAIVVASKAQPDSLNRATIAIVDDDQSQLTKRLADAFIPPMFIPPKFITQAEIDGMMDQGKATFVVVFPTTYMLLISRGIFNKALEFRDLVHPILIMLIMIPIILGLGIISQKKQET